MNGPKKRLKNKGDNMRQLCITLLNVGFGDSIFLEYEDGSEYRFGLIDSNDTTKIKNSHCYLNRYFKQFSIEKGITLDKPYFEFVMISHDHSDHTQGIKDIMREYGTDKFYYSKSQVSTTLAAILKYVKRQKISNLRLQRGDAICLGPVKMKVLWPGGSVHSNVNNDSIVLLIEFENKKILLMGDVENSVWDTLKKDISKDINLIKLPHHGSRTGFFDGNNVPIWYPVLDKADNRLGISTNPSPKNYHLPSVNVINSLDAGHYRYYRTDMHENIKFVINKDGIQCKYSHV